MEKQRKIILTLLFTMFCVAIIFGSLYTTKSNSKVAKKCPKAKNATYKFEVTKHPGNFDQVREQCSLLGGDLITTNMGPEGEKYHDYIRRIARTHAGSLWVGLTDRGTEGTWRFITSNKYFEPNKGNTLFQWSVRDGVKEPNNGDGLQHCACFWFKGMNLDDQSCSNQLHGLCEIKTFT